MTQAVNIKVEPYWNVNTDLSPSKKLGGFIKVEPYWNVNDSYNLYNSAFKVIKVEPYWNVNLSVLFNCIPI